MTGAELRAMLSGERLRFLRETLGDDRVEALLAVADEDKENTMTHPAAAYADDLLVGHKQDGGDADAEADGGDEGDRLDRLAAQIRRLRDDLAKMPDVIAAGIARAAADALLLPPPAEGQTLGTRAARGKRAHPADAMLDDLRGMGERNKRIADLYRRAHKRRVVVDGATGRRR